MQQRVLDRVPKGNRSLWRENNQFLTTPVIPLILCSMKKKEVLKISHEHKEQWLTGVSAGTLPAWTPRYSTPRSQLGSYSSGAQPLSTLITFCTRYFLVFEIKFEIKRHDVHSGLWCSKETDLLVWGAVSGTRVRRHMRRDMGGDVWRHIRRHVRWDVWRHVDGRALLHLGRRRGVDRTPGTERGR